MKILLVVVLLAVFSVLIATLLYLVTRFHKFAVIERLSKGSKKYAWLLATVPVLAAVLAAVFVDFVSAIVVMLYLAVFWLLADGIQMLLTKVM